jgi:dolichyl-phosphate-mannose-protein mannosyltransferase
MEFEDHKYIYLRGTHAFAGSCLAPIIFLSAEQMGLSLPAAAIAGALVVFDNGLACISRFVFTDAFLFFFLCMSVYTSLKVRATHAFLSFSRARHALTHSCSVRSQVCNTEPSYNISLANAPSMLFPREWWFWAVACGLSMGGLCSVKWTGVGTVGIIGTALF